MRRTLVTLFIGAVLGVSVVAGADIVRGQSNGDTVIVPDIEQVYNSALDNLFDAAGEKFTDPELKAFYDRLTADISERLKTPVPYDPGIGTPTPEAEGEDEPETEG